MTRSLGAQPDQVPRAADDASGAAIIDGITVEYDHDGATRAVALCRMVNGSGRLWANSTDAATLDAAVTTEMVGTQVTVSDGVFSR